MSNEDNQLHINLIGSFSSVALDGSDVTPVGSKNQALLALLALSPGMHRSRRWIEDKLWSRFGPEHAGANLRQALAKIRKTAPVYENILSGDRNSISLDPKYVTVDVLQGDFASDEPLELLEGMDVRDPEFEEWLRSERSRFQKRLESARPREITGLDIRCVTKVHESETSALLGDILANQIGQNVAEHVRAWRSTATSTEPTSKQTEDIEICCNLIDSDGKANVFLKVSHLPTGRIMHSRIHEIEAHDDILKSAEPTAAMVFDVADRVLSKIPLVIENCRPEARATALSRLALYRMFSFDPSSLNEANGLLKQAHECDPNPVYLAWRSLARMIQLIELHSDNPEALREEAAELNHAAMESAVDNTLAQALISQVRVMGLGDAEGGWELAEQAVAQNPANAFAWNALATAQMRKGDHTEALKNSNLARNIARFSPFRQWWEVNNCVVNIACNRPVEAIAAGEAAARAAPFLRPAHRHLLALYAQQGEMDKAQATAKKLEKIEPGFSLDRFVNDELYPVRTLRTVGMLRNVRDLI